MKNITQFHLIIYFVISISPNLKKDLYSNVEFINLFLANRRQFSQSLSLSTGNETILDLLTIPILYFGVHLVSWSLKYIILCKKGVIVNMF